MEVKAQRLCRGIRGVRERFLAGERAGAAMAFGGELRHWCLTLSGLRAGRSGALHSCVGVRSVWGGGQVEATSGAHRRGSGCAQSRATTTLKCTQKGRGFRQN